MKEYDVKITETLEKTVTVQYPKPIQIGTELDDFQEAIGGGIEVTYPFEEEVGIVLNEEGKILGLPLNRAMRTEDGEVQDIYAGGIFGGRSDGR